MLSGWKYYFEFLLKIDLAVLNTDIKKNAFQEVRTAVGDKVNEVVTPKTTDEHVVGSLNFLRRAEVSQVQEEDDLLASYGPVKFDCNCETGKRIDFQECEPTEDRDVSFKKLST